MARKKETQSGLIKLKATSKHPVKKQGELIEAIKEVAQILIKKGYGTLSK